jgi:hypothetical protein
LLDSLYNALVAWLNDPGAYRLISPISAAASFLVALALLIEVLRKSRSLPRMRRTTGRIRNAGDQQLVQQHRREAWSDDC